MKKRGKMKQWGWWFGVVLVALVAVSCSRSEPDSSRAQPAPEAAPPPPAAHRSTPDPAPLPPPRPIPPYHQSAQAAKPFPRLLPASLFRDYPAVARSYQIANEIPGVIAQQPCFCYCDKFGHTSLLDCFASDHGAG